MRGPLDPKFRAALMRKVKAQFRLNLHGEHGPAHWARVRENGLRLCAQVTDADPMVVELFALLHDSQRVNDGHDPQHGQRAADWLTLLDLPLNRTQMGVLYGACALHSDGHMVKPASKISATMAVCWDADRLDLDRHGVGIMPDPDRLCTDAARALLPWAVRRSHALPKVIVWESPPSKTITLPKHGTTKVKIWE